MRRVLMTLFMAVLISAVGHAEITLDECLAAARDNYPTIKKYDLIASTQAIELSDIDKGWLPRVGAYAQGSVQNVVPSFPSTLSGVMQQMGNNPRGLGKVQYKVGVDLNQTVWDGGVSKSRRDIARTSSDVERKTLDVEMYGIRQRVESMYFGILLLESQIEQIEASVTVYESNLERLRAMLANGVAMQSDVDMVEAQLLGVGQQLIKARASAKGYREMLSLFTGLNLKDERLSMPSADLPATEGVARPELSLFDAQAELINSRRKAVHAGLMPKIGLFAQSYYGYPGIDYFKAMMSRDMTFNIVAGLKVSWNIDSFYTRKNSLRRLDIADRQLDAERETFLLNNSMQSASQLDEIRGIEAAMKSDSRIVELRGNVRRAAESQLRNGVIDATALTTKINDETQARLAASYHAIQRLQAIYNLKNTINQ